MRFDRDAAVAGIIVAMQETFEDAARELGLEVGKTTGVFPFPILRGVVEGQRVRARWSDRGAPVEAMLDPPLDLGLQIRRAGFVPRLSLQRKLWLDDANWDMEVDAFCDEPSRGALLFASDARRAVLGLNATNVEIDVNDRSAGVFVMQVYGESLVRALLAVARTATLIDKARRALPPSSALSEHAAALRPFAHEKQLAVTDTPLALWGDVRAVRLHASFPRTGAREHDVLARMSPLDGKLGPGLLVRRETVIDRARSFFGGQDLTTGDAAFDPAFLVQSIEAERTVAALDGEVRALMLDLRRRFEVVTLDDEGLTLRGPATHVPANEIANLLEAGCSVVEGVVRASGAVTKGPYR